MVRQGADRRDVRLRGDPGFGSLSAGGEAVVPLALLVGLGPGQALGLGGGGDLAGVVDQVEGFFDFWLGLGGFGLGFGADARAAGGLEFVQAALGFVGFAAEADGAAAETEGSGQRHAGGGGLAERFEGLEAEADDVGGEMEFVLGLGIVGREHLGRGLAGGVHVAGGAGEEQRGEAGEDGFQDGGWDRLGEGHGGGGLGLLFDVCSWRTLGGISLECKNKFFSGSVAVA